MSFRTGRKGRHPDAPRPIRVRAPITLPNRDARAIARGDKTMFRIPAGAGPYRLRVEDPVTLIGLYYQDGKAKRDTAGHVIITGVRREKLADLTFADARAEGHRTREEFFAAWCERHELGLSPAIAELLQRIADAPCPLPAAAIQPGIAPGIVTRRLRAAEREQLVTCDDARRWEITEHASDRLVDEHDGLDLAQEVWAITVRRDDRETVRLLTPAARPAGTEYGYTNTRAQALPAVRRIEGGRTVPEDEPEVMDPDQGWKDAAAERHAAATSKDLAERLEQALKVAGELCIDVGSQSTSIEKRIAALERRITHARRAA